MIVVLNLYVALAALFLLARIAFFLAIAFFIYLLWRERRERHRTLADAGEARVLRRRAADRRRDRLRTSSTVRPAWTALAFLLILGLCGFAMWRVWRDQHTLQLGLDAGGAPSSASSAARIGTCWPTKIGVSRSV